MMNAELENISLNRNNNLRKEEWKILLWKMILNLMSI